MAITFDNPSDISALLNSLKADAAAQTPQSPAPDPTAFKPAPGESAAPLDVEETDPPKKDEPKPKSEPETKASTPAADPKPDATDTTADTDTKTDAKPDTKTDADTKTESKPDSKPDTKTGDAPDAKGAKPTTWGEGFKGFGVAAWDNAKSPVKGIPGLVKAEYRLGALAGDKAAGKIASDSIAAKIGKVGLKGAGRLLPGVGLLYGGYQAWTNFSRGDWIGGTLGLVSCIPGPIGWLGVGASMIWEIGGWGDKYEMWAKPDGTNTLMLPAAAKDETGVSDMDAQLAKAQREVFSFEMGPQGSVWDQDHPEPLKINGPAVQTALDAWLSGITDLFAKIDQAFTQSDEPYFQQQRQRLAPHFNAMADMKGYATLISDQFSTATKGAGDAYDAVLGLNKAARQQLQDDGKISDTGPATAAKRMIEQAVSMVTAADAKLEQIAAGTPAVEVPVSGGTTNAPGTKEPYKAPSTTPTPSPNPSPLPSITPQQTAPKQETPKTDDAINKLLSQLGQQAKAPTSAMPTSGLGGGSPLGNTGLGGGNPSSTPLSQTKPEVKDREPKKLTDEKKPTDRKREDVKPLTATKPENEKAQVKPAQPEQKAAPAAAPVAAAAPTPAQQNAAHHAKETEKPNTDVDVKGTKATFPDPKTAKMAQLLSQADPAHPKSLADAAAEAGLKPPVPGQDPGKQVNPADAKAGDVLVSGNKNFMLLGDGKFYDLTDYKVVGADEIPKDMGDRAGYFRLEDPNPGQPGPGGQQPGPVSGQTGGVAQPVSNPTGAQPGPVAGNPPAPGMPPAAPGGVPSVGAPGVPKPGAPGSGPGNAGETATGTGQGGASVGGRPLDPGVVR
ncbi:hypothetical protein [Mycolicibacterium mageritense]|uniref:hypothetical protein n=1 Tax=Mycolicibacterium mageritense TaxID=53462 RepID=UPI0011D8FF9D|nr:hypothetical protein [Mycolicibacterium mageritense]TXI62488.1 MAG: hypothetical protein E6Q55_12760 [Mycolicibacterium mageritense]